MTPGLITTTGKRPLPLIVTPFWPGPTIASPVGLRSDKTSGPLRSIVWGVANSPVVSNTTVLGAALGAALAGFALVLKLAQSMAAQIEPTAIESRVVVTR